MCEMLSSTAYLRQIRQRLLENNTLTLEAAFQQARALEQAQTQAASYENGVVGAVSAVSGNDDGLKSVSQQQQQQQRQQQEELYNNNIAAVKGSNSKDICFFCGKPRHDRSNCPARDSECRNCKKKGHWAQVCKSSKSSGGPIAAIPHNSYLPSLA